MTTGTEDLELSRKEIRSLRSELKARIAEAAWLKAHYNSHLEKAMDTIRALRLASPPAAHALPAIEGSPEPIAAVDADQVVRLQAEIQRLHAAERRYLDRIEELKDALAARRATQDETR